MRRWVPILLMLLAAGHVGGHAAESSGAADPADADPVTLGRRIYREGILPSGQPLQGISQANVTLVGADAACATCHRRSGYGSSEGPIEVRSITASALFGEREPQRTVEDGMVATTGLSPAEAARVKAAALRQVRTAAFTGSRQRPAYDHVSLARAITVGIDASGHKMNASMPRYALAADELDALAAYLKTLSVQVPPGVTDHKVHFATVIQPGVDPTQRRALLDVLQTFIKDRNEGLRDEVRREQAGAVRLQRTYRDWVLHVWDLSGASDTWPQQLEAYNRTQPVFALVSGIGHESWRPIHEFSERFEVPCFFPQVDIPVLAERDFYTVYLSKGIALEAEALAKFLHGEQGGVTQVFRSDGASAAAAAAFRRSWTAVPGRALVDRMLDHAASEAPDERFWQRLLRETPDATFVLWLPSQDLVHALVLTAAASEAKVIYLSSSLIAGPRVGLAADGSGRVRLVYPQDLPALRAARLELAKRWLRNRGVALSDERVQMNAYLAVTAAAMVVSHSMGTYSRELLLERMEHRLGTADEISIYPHLSLGPGQRYASKGAYIVKVDGADDLRLTPVSDWIVP